LSYFQAQLLVGESIFKIEAIDSPVDYLRIFTPLPIPIRAYENHYGFSSLTVDTAILVFKLDHSASYGQTYATKPMLTYRFVYSEGTEKHSCPMQNTIDIDFPPTDKVNLNNLKDKFRKGEKMVELLKSYYQTG